jgi:type II secretory pathway pseudopilin PulG
MRKNGFGLLEVLLAAGLITILIGGAVVLGSVVFRNTQVNQHKMQAMYLNQEAIEAVKQIQRTNWVKQDPQIDWNQDLRAGVYSLPESKTANTWELRTYSSDNQKDLNGIKFDRKITIENIKADKKIVKNDSFRSGDIIKKVTSEVSWLDFGKTQSVKIQTLISDWKAL